MIDFQAQNKKLIAHLISYGALKTPRIIRAFKETPRHLFVPEEYLSQAYADYPLPILHNQTISQPYTVAVMTEALQPKLGEKVLEIGSGSGWQAAILARCVGNKGKVITLEIEKDLVEFARRNIKKLGLKNIRVIHADGKLGYKREAPYDKSIITAACNEIPKPIIEQTRIGGRIVAPVNSLFGQRMIVADKVSGNELKKKDLGSFVFVPLR